MACKHAPTFGSGAKRVFRGPAFALRGFLSSGARMNSSRSLRSFVVLAASTFLFTACAVPSDGGASSDHGHGKDRAHAQATSEKSKVGASAIAVLMPAQGKNVRGTIRFTQQADGVRVVADVTGLQPNSRHGFHVHEKGDLSAPDYTSAGGHFNPEGHPHGAREAQERHAGDFGNLEADADGRARMDFVDTKISLHGKTSIIGRAVIVHEKADDLTSQPTGDAGGRIAGGVVGFVSAAPGK